MITITENIKVLPKYRVEEENQKIACKKRTTKKAKTPEQYKQELIYKNINVIPLEDYVGANIAINHKFPCGHINKTRPSSILRGDKCLQCKNIKAGNSLRKTTDQYRQELGECNSDVEVLEEYINARTAILHKYPCGHINSVIPGNVLKGLGCGVCSKKKSRPKKTTKEYVNELQLKNPEIEVLEEYIGAKTKIEHKHKICGTVWSVTPTDLLSGNGCPRCVGRGITAKEFFDEFKQKGVKSLVLTGNYINQTTKIDGYCNVCGNQISIEPYRLLKGVGCKKCMNKLYGLSKRMSHEDFIKRMSSENPSIEILGKYQTSHDYIDAKCLSCGTTWSAMADTLFRAKCPKCTAFKAESIVENYLVTYNIRYTKRMTYYDLRGVGHRCLSYDFYLPQYNLLIECQGKQHEHPVEYFGGIKKFIIQKIHDTRKRRYAQHHNIKLLEIWYYENNKINKILAQTLNNLKSESLTTAG